MNTEANYDEKIGKAKAKLINSINDNSNPINNAVVRIESNGMICSGVLISSTIILTAAHCFDNNQFVISASRRKLWEWSPLLSDIRVIFGNDILNPVYIGIAKFYNSVGLADIIMLSLSKPVDYSIAKPYRVLTRIPYDLKPINFLKNKTFIFSGWGLTETGNLPRYRQTAEAKCSQYPFDAFGITNQNNSLKALGVNNSQLMGGDSGSPLIWINPYSGERFVLGIAQGTEPGGGRFTVTFGKGGKTGINEMTPDISKWIEYQLYFSVLPNEEIVVPAFSWWNKIRKDNYFTTKDSWSIFPSMITYGNKMEIIVQRSILSGKSPYLKQSYELYRHNGYIFNPNKPQPLGTVPLFSWWNANRADNFTTSSSFWTVDVNSLTWDGENVTSNENSTKEGYSLYRLEGYVFDPSKPQPPNTIPLFSWWNAKRTDNFLTSNPAWNISPNSISSSGEILNPNNINKIEGYQVYRLEGYIYPNYIL